MDTTQTVPTQPDPIAAKLRDAHDSADEAIGTANRRGDYDVPGEKEIRAAEAMGYAARSIAYSVEAAAMLAARKSGGAA